MSAAGRIENCLAIDLVAAWRIFSLAKQGRETPNDMALRVVGEAVARVTARQMEYRYPDDNSRRV